MVGWRDSWMVGWMNHALRYLLFEGWGDGEMSG